VRAILYSKNFIIGWVAGVLMGIIFSVVGDVREASFWDFAIWTMMLAFMTFINYDAGQYIKRLRDR
jgi:membrane-associated PAP2 superfamily phosphatase